MRLFLDSPSTYIWEDEVGDVWHVCQGGSGEQGDPLMPLLFSLGSGSASFALWNDFTSSAPSRVGEVYLLLQRHLLEQIADVLKQEFE